MSKLFSSTLVKRPKRSVHDLSYPNKLSLHFGRLAPMMMERVVPSDKFKVQDEFLCRFAPFFGQVFQAFQLRTEYFFVPSRLLWKNFELFLANGFDGKTEFVHPYFNAGYLYNAAYQKYDILVDKPTDEAVDTWMIHSIFDYFNFPTDHESIFRLGLSREDTFVDCLPFYAYVKSYLDFYADENLEYMPFLQYFASDGQFAIDGDNTWRLYHLFNGINNLSSYVDPDGVLDNFSYWKYCYENSYPIPVDISYVLDFMMAAFKPFYRAYPKDYFTSALPFAQRGPIVQIPLDGSGDVVVRSTHVGARETLYQGVGVEVPDAASGEEVDVTLFTYGHERVARMTSDPTAGAVMGTDTTHIPHDNPITFKAVNVNGEATITDLRTAFAVQSWLEKRARTGVRKNEVSYASFGVRAKDYRLDRAEFLQGFKSTVKIGEVFTTAQSDDGSFVPGLGVSVGQMADTNKSFKKYFEEHGYLFGNVCIYPSAAYSQGIPRQFLDLDLYDYLWPEFQHIGEQPIYNIELMPRTSGNFGTFGYTPRYAQYKTRNAQIHGDFRASLKYMTSSRIFSTSPTLSNNFVQAIPSVNDSYRVFNATSEWATAAPAYVDIFHHCKAVRPLTFSSSPRLI